MPTSSTQDLREILYDGDTAPGDYLSAFASFLFVHNAGIGIICFALGFAFGLPTALLLIQNGLMLGAFVALYVSHGLGIDIGAWLIIHGSTELLAIAIAGGAGFALGGAVLFPGGKTRLAALAETGRIAGQVALGCVLMFCVAGMLEGFARQWVVTVWARYAIGGLMLAFWMFYFLQPLAARAHDDDQ
jgi:uncharacterized membrane protein SpoIIM required for sporulation